MYCARHSICFLCLQTLSAAFLLEGSCVNELTLWVMGRDPGVNQIESLLSQSCGHFAQRECGPPPTGVLRQYIAQVEWN